MKKYPQAALGLALGLFLIWWLFRDMDWPGVVHALRNAHPLWLLAATGFMFLTFVARVQRWSYIVRTAKPVPFRTLFSATQIGFLATFTLPLRAGEFIRAYVLARLAKLPFSQCFAFVALDRVTDIAGLIAVMIVSLLTLHPGGDIILPKQILANPIPANFIQTGAIAAGIALALVVGSLVLLYLNRELALKVADQATHLGTRVLTGMVHPFSKGLTRRAETILLAIEKRVHVMLDSFADGLHVFRSAPDMAKSIAFSLLTWFFAVLFLDCTLNAFGVERPWYTSCIMQAAIAAAVSVPGPPGFIGLYHTAVLVALGAVGAVNAKTGYAVAGAVALVMHLLNLVPVVVVGLICLKVENLGLLSLRRASEDAAEVNADVETVEEA